MRGTARGTDRGAFHCAAVALLNEKPKPTRDDVRHALSGNLCRCGAYDHYVNAVMRAADAGDRISQA